MGNSTVVEIKYGSRNIRTALISHLQHAVHTGQSLGQFLHRLWLVKVCPESDEDVFVGQHDLPQFLDLAANVPHQGLVQQANAVGTWRAKECRREIMNL